MPYHENRKWHVADDVFESFDQIVKWITEYSLTPCSGFRWKGLLWLNDCTGPDGAQEYALVRAEAFYNKHGLTATLDECERLEALRLPRHESD